MQPGLVNSSPTAAKTSSAASQIRSEPSRPPARPSSSKPVASGPTNPASISTTPELTFVGIAGDLVLRVPPGSRVHEGGFSLLGDRQIRIAAGDGPEIQAKVYGLFSDVKVTDQPT